MTIAQPHDAARVAADNLAGALDALDARLDYQTYVAQVVREYVVGWMTRDLCRRLQRFSEAVRRRESPRLMISMPPRHGKSLHGAECFTSWHLGHAPHDEIVVASYGLDLARKMTREARSLVANPRTRATFPSLHLSADSAEKADWRTRENGGAQAAGAGGALTGRGADILIIDDPFKDHREAMSARVREDRWQWYCTVARTRVSPGGGVLMIGTRWHQDDLIARAQIDYEHEGWEVVNYAAIAEQDEYHDETSELLREEGEALQPGRWSIELLESIKKGMPRAWWSALYDGRPTDPEGEIWSDHQWRRWTTGPPTADRAQIGWRQLPRTFERIFVSADLTFGSLTESASFNVIQTWGFAGGALYLLEEARGRWEYPEQRETLRRIAQRHRGCKVYVEEKATGKSILAELRRAIPGIEGIRPTDDKVTRARAAEPLISAARVFIPDDKASSIDMSSWGAEVFEFPTSANDDRVDAATQIISKVLVTDAPGQLFFGGGRR